MEAVVFKTPTVLDIRAITTFGINAKPNSNSPIGFFGTGLKYAIAVCLREGLPLSIYIGKTRYRFSVLEDTFRDKEFGFIQMEWNTKGLIPRRKTLQMPFTTELGKTWQLWQAFRELYSNTLDEAGTIDCYDLDIAQHLSSLKEDETLITVYGESFVQEYHDRDKIFYPQASRNRIDKPVEHFFVGSNHIYYRGMRIFDLEKPSRVTYNILANVDLTEDRTAKYPFLLEAKIRDYIVESEDPELIKVAMESPPGTYEHRFDFGSTYTPPSNIFSSYVRTHKQYIHNETVFPYLDTYDPSARKEAVAPTIAEQFVELLRASDWGGLETFLQDNQDEIIKQIEHGKFETTAF